MNYHDISPCDQNNGDGLRVVLWLSGCSHGCYNCQNPQTWKSKSGILFDTEAKNELFAELKKDYISGLTLSGGDPLYSENLEGVLDLVNETRLLFPEKTIWLYSGYCWEEIMDNQFEDLGNGYSRWTKRALIVSKCDIMVDGRFIYEQKDLCLRWRGSKNQRVIDVRKSFESHSVVLHCK